MLFFLKVIIIADETWSGKITQVPQYLHEAGYTVKGKVCHLLSSILAFIAYLGPANMLVRMS